MATLQPWSIKLLAREIASLPWIHSEKPTCWRHTTYTTRGEDRQLDPSPALFSEDAPTEESAMLLSLGTEPGLPA
eukprot:2428373-Amphidinium_carterae.1